MPAPLRIAYVIDSIESPTGGTERQLLALLRGLDRRRFQPHLVCLRESEWMRTQEFGFPVTPLGVASLSRPSAARALFAFLRLCRDARFDVVQTFFIDGNLFGTVGAALAGRPLVVSSRRNVGHWQNRIHVALLRGLRPWTHHYLANSEAAARTTREREGVDPARITVIRNGYDFQAPGEDAERVRARQRETWQVGREEILVGCVANLRKIKNLHQLVDAAATLAPSHPRLRFVVVGEGPDRPLLEREIAARGLGARFRLAGKMLDVRPALAALDIAVLCSRAESASNSLIEYMAAALPVVASDIAGNAEILDHGATGILYPLDSSGALAAEIARVAADPGLRVRLGQAASRRARDQYSLEGCIRAHESFYLSLVEQR